MPEDEKMAEDLNEGVEQIETQEQETETTEVQTWNIVPDASEDNNTGRNIFNRQVEENIETEDEQEVEQVEEQEENENSSEYVELDEDYAIKYLAEKRGLTVDEFNESLKPKQEVEKVEFDAETEAFLKYKKETGRGYNDFIQTQKDWTQEPKENVLKMVMKIEKPYLSDEEIDLLIEDKYATEELDDYAEPHEVRANRLKEIALKEDYQQALSVLEKQKEQYMVRRSSDETVPEEYKNAKAVVDNWQKQQEENRILLEKQKADFEAKTNNVFNEKFEGFETSIAGQTFKVKPEDVAQAKNQLSDITNFDKKFFDETGLKDPKGYYKALYFGMNADKMAEHFFNLGKSTMAEEEEKKSKNIPVPGTKNVQSPMAEGKSIWKVVKD